jgi:7-cyano-7-deazaguanine synthase
MENKKMKDLPVGMSLQNKYGLGRNKKQAVLSLSGGMDSSTVLLHLLTKGYEVTALSFDYGQKHNVELERAAELVEYLDRNGYPVKYQRITLQGLVGLLDSALVKGGADVPEGHYEEDNMKDTVVPNRNKIFSSIIQAVALSIAQQKDCDVKIAMGIHAGDHAIYPDCRQEFRDADYKAFTEGNWDAERVTYYTPYLDGNKFDILKDGERCCKKLGLDFNQVYVRTNTSYKPIHWDSDTKTVITDPSILGRYSKAEKTSKWYSDYKSASSVERVEAFIKLGRPDPAEYADETGPVTWEHVVTEVTKVLNHKI